MLYFIGFKYHTLEYDSRSLCSNHLNHEAATDMSDEKKKRSSAKGRFTRSVKSLEKCINDPDFDRNDAQKHFNDVESAWQNVEMKHEDYISTLEEDQLSVEEKWIDELEKKYHDIRKRYVKLKSDCDVLLERKSREKGRAVAFETFSQLSENLKTSVDSKYPIETILREKTILERQFESVKSKHSEFAVISETSDEQANKQWLLSLIEKFGVINSIADKYLISFEKKPKMEKETVEKVKGNLNMEKMPLPRFYGDPRFYLRFKKDFEELVLPHLDSREAVFTLRQCLGKNVEAVLGSGDFDIKQIFKRLDERYGDPGKITDAIICEIQKFRKIESEDGRRVVEFINLIEKAFYDLKSVGMEREISNVNVTSIIESKLPKSLALNWYRFIHCDASKVDKSNKFPELLNFLSVERKALEYSMSDLRYSFQSKSGMVNYIATENHSNCLIHNDGSHKTSECKTYLKMTLNNRYDLMKQFAACFSCLSPNHLMSECKNRIKCIHGCGKYHHETLHSPGFDKTEKAVNTIHNTSSTSNSCLFPIMRVKIGNAKHYANVLWDCCASVCLITEAKAQELSLQGIPSEISITVVGGVNHNIQSKRYNIPLVDLMGRTFYIEAYSINAISNFISGLNLSKIKKCFPDVKEEQIRRPRGEIDILIGYNYAGWHPIREQSNGHLLILSNSFGKCVWGSHPEIFEKTIEK